MKSKKPQDERVVAQRRKIQSDAFGILFFVLLISVIIQQMFLEAPFEQYVVELICFLGMAAYMLVRNIAVGNNLYSEGKRAKFMPLINSLICGITATVVFGILNYMRNAEYYENNIGVFIAALAIFFVSCTLFAFASVTFLNHISNKRQASINRQLDEDEDL